MTLQSDVKIKNISKLTWIYHNTILKILIKSVPDVIKTTSSTFLKTSESEESIEHNFVFRKQFIFFLELLWKFLVKWILQCILLIATSALSKLEAVRTERVKEIILREIFSDFYDRHSMTCSSALFDPSVESDFVERNLQHHVGWRKLSSEKNVVRLTSGSYSACGFEILLKRKHEPFMYQVELNWI